MLQVSGIVSTNYSELGYNQIPAKPELALGSIVDCETVQTLQEYIGFQNTQKAQLAQLEGAREQVKQLERQIQTAPAIYADISDMMIPIFEKQKGQYLDLINRLTGLLSETREMPSLENLQVTAESPIDLQQTNSIIAPEGYQRSHLRYEVLDQRRATIEVLTFLNVEPSDTCDDLLYRRVKEIEGVAQITQIVALQNKIETGKVLRLGAIQYDKEKLQGVLEAMKGDNASLVASYGISTVFGEKAIAIITGAELGGAFTGLFLHRAEGLLIENQGRELSNSCDFSQKALLEIYSPVQKQSLVQLAPNAQVVAQGIRSIATAFGQFTEQLMSNPASAIPIKYTYTLLTQSNIESILNR